MFFVFSQNVDELHPRYFGHKTVFFNKTKKSFVKQFREDELFVFCKILIIF